MDELSAEKKKWLELAEGGDPLGTFNIGKYYTEVKNYEEAKKWLGKLANQGHLGGLFKYGELLVELNEKEKAKKWLKQAADRGHMKAKALLEEL